MLNIMGYSNNGKRVNAFLDNNKPNSWYSKVQGGEILSHPIISFSKGDNW